MKAVGFMVVSGFVSGVLSRFLPEVIGLQSTITLIGTLSAIAGGAIGILFKDLNRFLMAGLVILSLGMAVFSLVQYNSIVGGESGPDAAERLYLWTVLIFFPFGVLIEVAGLNIAE